MVRVDLLAPPYRGHLHPILAIGAELAARHEVRVLSTPAAARDVLACGLEPVTLLDAAADAELAAVADPARAIGANPVRLRRQLRRTLDVLARVRPALDALWADEARRPDLAIADFTLPVAGPVAAARGIQWWTALPSPCVLETAAGPPAYLGGWTPRDGASGRARDAVARTLVRGFKRGVGRLERARLAALGVDGVYRADGTEAAYSPVRVLALGLEELEFGRGWPGAVRFVGPYLPGPMPEGCAPAFMAGRRHVLVTCGTHLSWAKAEVRAAAAAVARTFPGLYVHVADGRPDADGIAAASPTEVDPPNLARLAWVDYASHVRRYALVVHHGGAGIAYRCLGEGVPSVVWPRDYDQFDNAARLERAGLAVRVRTVEALPAAVGEALDDPRLADRCRAIARRLRRERDARHVSALVETTNLSGP